jgi:hypothetical protein
MVTFNLSPSQQRRIPLMKDTPAHGRITLVGTVRKLIDLPSSHGAQQAKIALDGADYLYDEVRVANVHK